MIFFSPWATRREGLGGWAGVHSVFFEVSEYGPVKIRLFAFKRWGFNMLKYANSAAITENPFSINISEANRV